MDCTNHLNPQPLVCCKYRRLAVRHLSTFACRNPNRAIRCRGWCNSRTPLGSPTIPPYWRSLLWAAYACISSVYSMPLQHRLERGSREGSARRDTMHHSAVLRPPRYVAVAMAQDRRLQIGIYVQACKLVNVSYLSPTTGHSVRCLPSSLISGGPCHRQPS